MGVGWTVEMKLNRKKKTNWIPTGGGVGVGCDPLPPLDSTLVLPDEHSCVVARPIRGRQTRVCYSIMQGIGYNYRWQILGTD